jgi:hypothetical protein
VHRRNELDSNYCARCRACLRCRLHGRTRAWRRAEQQKEHYDEVNRKLAAALSQLHAQRNARTVRVERVVAAPLYRAVCLDDDGLRLANEALANAATGTADALPSACADAGCDSGNRAADDRRN